MRSATTSPDAKVSAATIHMAAEAERVGGHAGEQRADGVAEVAPEPVDADRRRAPRRVRDVADGGEQRRVDHRRAEAEQRRADGEAGEAARTGRSRAMPTACTHMPEAMSHLRPTRSDSAPVKSCAMPQVAG